ncbi:DUF3604 domain-containing protein [Halobium salinum]|uniref:DUF3604 domain-containing protein n=1 Tax=Halobium salinum TaxID=1364940 RepID=A0ABD5P8P0_9EURY|nr:DUF3604 domain-containing protein [Halobium salinum]
MAELPASLGPVVKATETAKVFADRAPSPRELVANRDARFERVHAVLPADADAGAAVSLSVQAWDQCERLLSDFEGTFGLASTDPEAILPETVSFDPPNGGLVRVDAVEFHTPGVQYLVLDHRETGRRFVTNPVRVHPRDADPEYRTYWGDLHLHSALSDGTGTPERGLAFGREVMNLDVVAYTDHDTMGFFIPPSTQRKRMHRRYFDRTREAVEAANDPGEFVSLMAYEWTKQPNQGGHVNVYFDDPADATLFDSLDADTDTYEKLFARLRAFNDDGSGEALAIPHHPAESMYPFDFSAVDYDDEVAPLVEVYSQWGSSERPGREGNRFPLRMGQGEVDEPGHYVQDALRMGYRVGMMASADYHGPHPGHSLIHTRPHLPSLHDWVQAGLGWSNVWRVWDEQSYPGGLVAIRAPELTREAVFDALRSRRVYGTTQPNRTLVEFTVDGVGVGEAESTAVVDDPTAEREVTVEVAGDAPLDSVTVVKNAEPWRTWEPESASGEKQWAAPPVSAADGGRDTVTLSGFTCEASWTDDDPVEGMAWDDARGSDADAYYVRVEQVDGGAAWAGPVWVAVGRD